MPLHENPIHTPVSTSGGGALSRFISPRSIQLTFS